MEGLTIENAHKIIQKTIQRLPAQNIALIEASGRIVAESIKAVNNLPAENQSAVDGYALGDESLIAGRRFKVSGYLKLGDHTGEVIKNGQAVGVLTGGVLPPGTKAVVPHEKVLYDGVDIMLLEEMQPGANIKQAGEDFCQGEELASAGNRITPGLIGLFAAFGFSGVEVYRPVRVAILAIGENVVDFVKTPGPGQTRDSNGPMLTVLIKRIGGAIVSKTTTGTQNERLPEIMFELSQEADLILITGGTYLRNQSEARNILEEAGASILYWGTHIQPGGHNGLAVYNSIPVFALSGHPAACAVGFHIFAAPAIRYMQGLEFRLKRVQAKCTNSYSKTARQHRMVRGYAFPTNSGWKVTVLPGQKPGMLRSLINCNALIHMPPGYEGLEVDELVSVILV